MNKYIRKKPAQPTFSQVGLKGYRFNTASSSFEVYEVDVIQGHDNFIISKEITHMYYILSGAGIFSIDGETVKVITGDFLEIPIGLEYTYTGKMKLLLLMEPPWFEGNEVMTKPNKKVRQSQGRAGVRVNQAPSRK